MWTNPNPIAVKITRVYVPGGAQITAVGNPACTASARGDFNVGETTGGSCWPRTRGSDGRQPATVGDLELPLVLAACCISDSDDATPAGRVLVLVADLHVRVLSEDGELLRDLVLDPSRTYQPQA
jgi:hypothetical protein